MDNKQPKFTSSSLESSKFVGGEKWQRQLCTWDEIKRKFGIDDSRYREFSFLKFLDISDPFVQNYVGYQIGKSDPIIKGRLSSHINYWLDLNPPEWLLSLIKDGVKIPFNKEPPQIILPNNKSSVERENIEWIRETLREYLKFGFIKKVILPPKVISPLQVSVHSTGKKCLIHDESVLNEFIEKQKFKLEGWEEMLQYCGGSNFGIQFDMKKFYYEIDIDPDYQKYFGFMYPMEDGLESTYFVWTVLPYGYTRAPYLARSLMKPLIAKWRRLGILVVVFYDDGMAVSSSESFLSKASTQIQCDLLRCGLFPGFEKCNWTPSKLIDWVGLRWDFETHRVSILPHRIEKTSDNLVFLLSNWPKVTFRDVSCLVGQIISMYPVLGQRSQLRTRSLQTLVNVRHFYNCAWDRNIFSRFGNKLFLMAKEEIQFWLGHLVKLNLRQFLTPTPSVIGWVDASGLAHGGIMCKIKSEFIGSHKPLTADNLMLNGKLCDLEIPGGIVNLPRVFQSQQAITRDDYDLNLKMCSDVRLNHGMFTCVEMETDRNEREMIGGKRLILASKPLMCNSNVTLHFDNQNAAIIFGKGSPKFRLQKIAVEVDDLSLAWNFKLSTVHIPRSLNQFSDKISNFVDLDDYGVSDNFFLFCNKEFKVKCNIDRFANNFNTKTEKFNSLTYCLGTSGVDAFNYHWGKEFVNWLFPPPKQIMQTLMHLKQCNGEGLLVTPQWKASPFFPFVEKEFSKSGKKSLVSGGKDIFVQGIDKSSFFGPGFNCAVIVWHFDYS